MHRWGWGSHHHWGNTGGGFHHHWHRFHRGPSRLLWFMLGAGTAMWYTKVHMAHRDSHGQYFHHCYRPSFPVVEQSQPTHQAQDREKAPAEVAQPSRRFSPWRRNADSMPQQAPTPESNQSPTRSEQRAHWGFDQSYSWSSNSQPWGFNSQQQDKLWEEEKEKLSALAKQAGDAMSQLSDSTLDSVLNTVEALKNKLAEHREAKERQEKELEQKLENMKKNPPRWV